MPVTKAKGNGGTIFLHTDGASTGNPGPSGAGIVLESNATPPKAYWFPLGIMTNNQAEYSALILGLKEAVKLCPDAVHCLLDSELVVKQLRGEYKVRDRGLQSLHKQVLDLSGGIGTVTYNHVPREENAEADRLAKRGARANKR
jgi:ribonuclease HI